MVRRVLDTCVIAKWFLDEEGSDRAERFLAELLEGAGRILVPSSMFSELANIFWVRRSSDLTEPQAQAFWSEMIQLPVEVIEARRVLPQALALSFREEISPYDGTFVVLARDLDCDLITADRKLWLKVHGTCPWVKLL